MGDDAALQKRIELVGDKGGQARTAGVCINEGEMRDGNPNVPWTPGEIAADTKACRDAGAAIVHFHARKPDGALERNPRVCGQIIRNIRDLTDSLVSCHTLNDG